MCSWWYKWHWSSRENIQNTRNVYLLEENLKRKNFVEFKNVLLIRVHELLRILLSLRIYFSVQWKRQKKKHYFRFLHHFTNRQDTTHTHTHQSNGHLHLVKLQLLSPSLLFCYYVSISFFPWYKYSKSSASLEIPRRDLTYSWVCVLFHCPQDSVVGSLPVLLILF